MADTTPPTIDSLSSQVADMKDDVQYLMDRRIIQQDIVSGVIKERHMVVDTAIAKGDIFYGDGNNNIKRIPPGLESSLLTIKSGIPAWGGEIAQHPSFTFTSDGGAFTNNPTLFEPILYSIIGRRLFLNAVYQYGNPSGGSGKTIIGNIPLTALNYEAGSGVAFSTQTALSVLTDIANNTITVAKYDGTTAISNSEFIIFSIAYYLK